MTKTLENGQLEWLLDLDLEELEKELLFVNEEREEIQHDLKENNYSNVDFACKFGHLLELQNLASQILLAINCKIWEGYHGENI